MSTYPSNLCANVMIAVHTSTSTLYCQCYMSTYPSNLCDNVMCSYDICFIITVNYSKTNNYITRILIVSSLFSAFPWLIIPAFSLFSVAGCVIMLTNLQISNLFGERRYTVMSTLIGGYHASAVLFLCIKVSISS